MPFTTEDFLICIEEALQNPAVENLTKIYIRKLLRTALDARKALKELHTLIFTETDLPHWRVRSEENKLSILNSYINEGLK